MPAPGKWTGVEAFALQTVLDSTFDQFAALVGVTPSMVYRWRRAGPHANLRATNQHRLAEILSGLDEAHIRRFWDLLAQNTIREQDRPAPLSTALTPAALVGHWVTVFRFDNTRHHADIAHITQRSGRYVTASNYPPEPRSQDRTPGFCNEVDAELVGRHLIGRWWNVSDTYYFGALHLAVMPGETVLNGYCTGFPNDSTIVAERWKWVRLQPGSLAGTDLRHAVMKDPEQVYALVSKHSHTDSPLSLHDVAETR